MSEMKGSAVVYVRSPASLAQSEVVPAKDRAFVSEPYLVVEGFPMVPKYWVHGRSVTSATGEYVSRRDEPVDIELDAHTRFIANGFDNLSGVWKPWYTEGVDYLWLSPSGLEPNSEIRDYRLHKELLSNHALRFNPGDYLYSSFNQGIDDALAFSVVLVTAPLAPSGYTIFSTMDDQSELAVLVDNGFTLSYANQRAPIPFNIRALNHTPTYIVLTNDGATATLWVGTSPREMTPVSMRLPSAQVARMRFYLGKTHGGKATATMDIFEFSLFDHALDRNGVYEVIASLATAYG